MPRRRSRLDIVLSVLNTVKEGVNKPTRIMYATNLSWKPTQRILNTLVEQGLLMEIENDGGRRTKTRYELTEKGSDVVRYFDKARDLIALEAILS
mgnify:CR=1 FL=1